MTSVVGRSWSVSSSKPITKFNYYSSPHGVVHCTQQMSLITPVTSIHVHVGDRLKCIMTSENGKHFFCSINNKYDVLKSYTRKAPTVLRSVIMLKLRHIFFNAVTLFQTCFRWVLGEFYGIIIPSHGLLPGDRKPFEYPRNIEA